jgi:hypothetical protein
LLRAFRFPADPSIPSYRQAGDKATVILDGLKSSIAVFVIGLLPKRF